MSLRKCFLACLGIACLALVPAFGQDAIPAGYDMWQTIGAGATGMDFASNPIPADFFCTGSEPFTGLMTYEGVPLKTAPEGALGTTDTIIQRLDDAVFNEKGIARTRLQAVALSLRGREPIVNRCGMWRMSVGLAKTQPVTELVYRRHDEHGGVYNADLVLNVRLTFRQDRNRKVTRSLERTVHFAEFHEAPYSIADEGLVADIAAMAVQNGVSSRIGVVAADPADTVDVADETEISVIEVDWSKVYPLPGYLCGPSGCIPIQQYHQAPTHRHITLPPCGTPQAQIIGWCYGGGVIIGTTNPVARIFRELKSQGLVQGDPEALAETLVHKGMR